MSETIAQLNFYTCVFSYQFTVMKNVHQFSPDYLLFLGFIVIGVLSDNCILYVCIEDQTIRSAWSVDGQLLRHGLSDHCYWWTAVSKISSGTCTG